MKVKTTVTTEASAASKSMLRMLLRGLGGKQRRDPRLLPLRVSGRNAINGAYHQVKDEISQEILLLMGLHKEGRLELARKLEDMALYFRITVRESEEVEAIVKKTSLPKPQPAKHRFVTDFERN